MKKKEGNGDLVLCVIVLLSFIAIIIMIILKPWNGFG